MMKNRAILVLLAPLALAACQKGDAPAPAASSEAEAASPAADSAASTLTDAPGGQLVLPAVPGHPAAAYIAWHNAGTGPATITGVSVDGAQKSEMHETKNGAMLPLASVDVAPGAQTDFAPGGRHVMVFGLPASIKAGDKVAYTLQLSDGSKLAGTLTAQAPGAAPAGNAGGMGDMKM
jgi:periplasmic copper chaperone A